jgi:polyisoprenoid-binding protein YceI
MRLVFNVEVKTREATSMKRKILSIAMMVVAAAGLSSAADTYTIDPAHSDVGFKIRHLVSKVTGQFNEFSGTVVADFGNLERSSVRFTIKAASIDTRNGDRDTHLRGEDFFDVEKYPEITFASSAITKAGDSTFNVAGTLTMHGVSREITLPVIYLGEVKDPWGNTKAGYQISTTLNRKDYGMVWNKALDSGSLILGDEVEVEINLEVAKS